MSIVTQIVCVVGFGEGSYLSYARKVRRDAPYGWGKGLTQSRKDRKDFCVIKFKRQRLALITSISTGTIFTSKRHPQQSVFIHEFSYPGASFASLAALREAFLTTLDKIPRVTETLWVETRRAPDNGQ